MNQLQASIERALGYTVHWGDTAAWVQAFGAILALGLAVWLPLRDRRRQVRLARAAAFEAADFTHSQIAAVWAISHGLAHGDPKDFREALERAASELSAQPMAMLERPRVISRIRQLADCARGAIDAIDGAPESLQVRSVGIVNFAHHLLVLIARDLGQKEPPLPPDHTGVPEETVRALKGAG